VYFAGLTIFTLGMGDYVPNGQPWEVLTAVAASSGLGLTTLAITYLVPVVGAVTTGRVQASTIAGMGATPQAIVISALHDRDLGYLERRLQALSDDLLRTAERHLSYPVLHYFHGGERHVDLRTQAQRLDEAVTLLRYGVTEDVRPHPAILEGVRYAIGQLAVRAPGEQTQGVTPAPPDLGPLRRAGIAVVDDETFARSVADLAPHRQRVQRFAGESLWSSEP